MFANTIVLSMGVLWTCIPYEKMTLLKNDSVTFLKMVLGWFQKSLKKGICFQTTLKKGCIFKVSLKKYPTRLGPGSWALAPVHPGPGPRVGYLFKSSLEMEPLFKIVWKSTPFFKLVWKAPQTHFQKCHGVIFSKFHLFIRDASPYLRSSFLPFRASQGEWRYSSSC